MSRQPIAQGTAAIVRVHYYNSAPLFGASTIARQFAGHRSWKVQCRTSHRGREGATEQMRRGQLVGRCWRRVMLGRVS